MKSQRPKTGFKQKNLNDLNLITYENINKYVDMLYEEKYEDKIVGARNILYLIRNPQNMIDIIQNEENSTVLGTLARTLRDEQKKSMELTLYLLAFFETYSYYYQLHPYILNLSIGEICLGIIDYNIMKYEYRKDEIIRWSTDESKSNKEYINELEKFLFVVRKQDRILKMAFLILMHLAEDPKIEYKMVKKDIVKYIIKNLNRPNINVLSNLLLFLKKLSIFQVNKDTMIKEGILDKLMVLFDYQHPLIWMLNTQILFNLSFDHTFRMKIIENEEYFLKLTEYFKLAEFRSNLLRLLYNLSLESKSLPLFQKSECLYIVFELLDKFPEKIIGSELAALTINLVTYPENAKKLGQGGRVKVLIERALKNSDFELIKIVKNIIKYSDDSDINEIYDNYVDNYFLKIINSKQESNEFLIETLDILSYIETDWSEKLEKFNLINFFEKNLKSTTYDDDLLIAVISFFGNVASDKDCAEAIANSNIINLLHSIILKKNDNYSIVFGIIFDLYQLLPMKETRKLIIENIELIHLVLSCLKCENSEITFVSLRFLEIVQLYDNKWSETIKRKKFKIYNSKIINSIKMIQNQLSKMGSLGFGEKGEYYDEEDGEMDLDEGNLYNYQYY